MELTVTVERDLIRAVQSAQTSVPVRITRGTGVEGVVTVELQGLPTDVGAMPVDIAASEDTAMMVVTVLASAAQGGAIPLTAVGVLRSDPSVIAQAPVDLYVAGPRGSLDLSFADQGVYSESSLSMNANLTKAALDPNGTIILMGLSEGLPSSPVWIGRVTEAGLPETDFGPNGLRTDLFTDPSGMVLPVDMVVFDDGVFVIAARVGGGSFPPYALRAFERDGSLESGFGVGGALTMSGSIGALLRKGEGLLAVGGDGILAFDRTGVNDPGYVASMMLSQWRKAGIDASGRLVLAGVYSNFSIFDTGFEAMRLNADGSLDMTFGTAGLLHVSVLTNSLQDEVQLRGLAVSAGGDGMLIGDALDFGLQPPILIYSRLFAAGIADAPTEITANSLHDVVPGPNEIYYIETRAGAQTMLLAIDHATNTMDTSFGTNGSVPSPVFGSLIVDHVVGRIIVAGWMDGTIQIARFWL
jgi:hypothetical protein